MEKREKYEWHHCCSMIASRCWKSPLSTPHSKAKCIIQVRWARSGSFPPVLSSLSANSNKFVNKLFLYYSTCAALMWKCACFLSVWVVRRQNAFNEVLFAMEFSSSARIFHSWLMIVYKRKQKEKYQHSSSAIFSLPLLGTNELERDAFLLCWCFVVFLYLNNFLFLHKMLCSTM